MMWQGIDPYSVVFLQHVNVAQVLQRNNKLKIIFRTFLASWLLKSVVQGKDKYEELGASDLHLKSLYILSRAIRENEASPMMRFGRITRRKLSVSIIWDT